MNHPSASQTQGTVYSFAISPDFEQDRLCFAASSLGLYRSEDGGQTWHSAYDSLNLTISVVTTAVAFSPDFAVDRSLFAAVPGHILRSTDGGSTWQVSAVSSPAPQITTLIVAPDFALSGTLLLGTLEDGVFRSTDRGEHWSSGNFGLLDLSVNCMVVSPDFANDEALFIGTQTGLFSTMNGGRAWREVSMPTGIVCILSLILSPHFGQDRTIFVGTDSLGLYHSDDRGLTWSVLGQAILDEPVNQIVLAPNFPDQPDVLVVLSNALLISRDRGQTWMDWKADLGMEQQLMCAAFPQGLTPNLPFLIGQAEAGLLQIV